MTGVQHSRLSVRDVLEAFRLIGFSSQKIGVGRWRFVRGEILILLEEIHRGYFDIVHLFADAKTHGVDEELYDILNGSQRS